MKSSSVTFQMKAIQQYFSVVLFVTLNKLDLTLKSVDEPFKKCNYSKKSYRAMFPFGVVCFSIFCKIFIYFFLIS